MSMVDGREDRTEELARAVVDRADELLGEGAALTLTEFLLARIAEDEAMVGRGGHFWDEIPEVLPGLTRERWRAECEAKRRIVDSWMAQWSIPEPGYPSRPLGGQGGELYYDVLCHLAAIYADHPDYRQEWAL